MTDWTPLVAALTPLFGYAVKAYFQNKAILEEQKWARVRHYRLEWMTTEVAKKLAPGLLEKVPDNLKTGIHRVPLLDLDVFQKYDEDSERIAPDFGPPPDWVPPVLNPKGKKS